MNDSMQRLNLSVQNLEELIAKHLDSLVSNNNQDNSEQLLQENAALREKLEKSRQEYQLLKETSKDVINELNNSIQIIEDYFKKQHANNQNS